jgi:hypothetical protein
VAVKRLPDNGDVKTPRDQTELVAGAYQACTERQWFGHYARACTYRFKILPSGFDRGFIIPFNHFQFRRNVAGVRDRHDRAMGGKGSPAGGRIQTER